MKRLLSTLSASLLLISVNASAGEVDPSTLPAKKLTPQGLYLTAKEAHSMVSEKGKQILFVDVRTPSELEFVGAPREIDANIPYMFNDFTEWDEKKGRYLKVPNSDFTVSIEEALSTKGLKKDDKIVLMCRSGSRSSKAANLLYQAGYKNVYSVIEGFEGDKAKTGVAKGHRNVNGWKNAGLPWTYKLSKTKMYFDF